MFQMLTSGLFDEKEKTLLSKLSREEEMFAVKNKNKDEKDAKVTCYTNDEECFDDVR